MLKEEQEKKVLMKNNTLFYSSVVSLWVHMWLFSWVTAFPHPWLHYTCVGTSLWNHGFTSEVAKWTDRAMITVCVGHNLYWLSVYNHHIVSWIGIILTVQGVSFYFVSKMTKQYEILFHLVSHVCATCSNVLLGLATISHD